MSRFRRRNHVNKYDKPGASASLATLAPELSAAKAIKKALPRRDVKDSMLKLCPVGWDYDTELARSLGTDTEGYYLVAEHCKVHVITPEMAEELYLYHNYAGQRSFDQAHAEHLSKTMVIGVHLGIAISPSGYPVLVNGQHTMWAIYMRGQHIQAQFSVYMCKDEGAVARVYSIFDSNKTRTPANILDAYRNSGSLDISHPSTRHWRWSQAVACAENDFSPPKTRLTNSEKAQRASRQCSIDFAQWIEGHLQGVGNRGDKLLPMGVAACFYAMFVSDKSKADEFIKLYLSGAVSKEHHPALVLRNRMTIGKPENEHGASAARTHAEIAYTCWGKFCRDEQLLATRRTTHLPNWDRWKIYVTPAEAREAT